MNPAITKAITVLEQGIRDMPLAGNFATIPAMREAISALRSIPRATEEELRTLLNFEDDDYFARFKGARLVEHFHFGSAPSKQEVSNDR